MISAHHSDENEIIFREDYTNFSSASLVAHLRSKQRPGENSIHILSPFHTNIPVLVLKINHIWMSIALLQQLG